MKNKFFLIPIVLIVLGGLSYWVYQFSLTQSQYLGLPVVSCIDPTLSVVQDFTFTLNVTVEGKPFALDSMVGHDPGKCLRVIHADDSSGQVRVQSNDSMTYTLGQFFNVWHKEFSGDNFMGSPLNDQHKLTVTVDGVQVSTLADTPLRANETISVDYR